MSSGLPSMRGRRLLCRRAVSWAGFEFIPARAFDTRRFQNSRYPFGCSLIRTFVRALACTWWGALLALVLAGFAKASCSAEDGLGFFPIIILTRELLFRLSVWGFPRLFTSRPLLHFSDRRRSLSKRLSGFCGL